MMRLGALLLAAASGPAATTEGRPIGTADDLRIAAELPARLGPVWLDGSPVSRREGGLGLIDPRTGAPPAAGRFRLNARARCEPGRVVISGVVAAAGEEETVCHLQAQVPVGETGWLWWDDASRPRAIRPGQEYVQTVYPLCCTTDASRQRGVAVALEPDPLQPATLSYDPQLRAVIVNWFLGFTPLGRPSLRMRAPFAFEVYRVQPGWAFRSALQRFYAAHPMQFDQRARYEGLWLFASPSESLPNPQHYAYDEGGPPPTEDLRRGLATFPYCCAGDLIVSLPVEWGQPKSYEETQERLTRWAALPRLTDWEALSPYEVDVTVARTGSRSLRLQASQAGRDLEVRQVYDLNQREVDPVTVSVWTKARDVTGPQDAHYSVWVDMEMADGEHQYGQTAPAAVGTHDWQELRLVLGPDKPIAQARLYLLFRQTHTGAVWFDDLAVTTASAPERNLARGPGFEDTGSPPEVSLIRDNAMWDEHDHPRYIADTWGGADVALPNAINWLRFTLLVNADQRNPGDRPTASDAEFGRYDRIFAQYPECAGAYLDGTSGWSTTTTDYQREHFQWFRDPFQYVGTAYRPCAGGMASVVRWVQAFRQRYGADGRLAFGNVWASDRMFPVCMALDVCGYESSRWYDLPYADYYRAAAYHKPGLLLNYFRIGQNLDTREGGERFFRYATAYGLFPSIGRATDEAYEKFGDLQHRYVPIVKHLFRAGWEPVTHAAVSDAAARVERFGTQPPVHFTVLNPTSVPREVQVTIETKPSGLGPERLEAVEMVTSAALPLSRSGQRATTTVTLGPEDVAVVVLLPADHLGPWLRGRAAEILRGAAYVHAQTPPTAAAAALAERLESLPGGSGPAAIASGVDAVRQEVAGLLRASDSLADDLKRRSYRRELVEAERLLAESLLADVGARIGWEAGRVAPLDGEATLAPRVLVAGGGARVTGVELQPGRLVEVPPAAKESVVVEAGRRLACPPEQATTAVATIAFTDAADQAAQVHRLGAAFWGPICSLQAMTDPGADVVTLQVTSTDRLARDLRVELEAPPGLTPLPATFGVHMRPRETQARQVRVGRTADLRGGLYPVRVRVVTARGVVAAQAEVTVTQVPPLDPGDLALPATGAQVAVDSAFYGYEARPLTDGVVLPQGSAFNAAAWASAEAPAEHWVQIQWPSPQSVGRVVLYWNIENGVVWTSQQAVVEVGVPDGWQTVGTVQPGGPEPVTESRFPAARTSALRVRQPQGEGPASRPNLMWLREVAVYPE